MGKGKRTRSERGGRGSETMDEPVSIIRRQARRQDRQAGKGTSPGRRV
jgi:hypothetical protein